MRASGVRRVTAADSAPGAAAAAPPSLLARLDAWCARAERRPLRWLVLFAALLALQVGPVWYATPDGASYLSIARSLAGGTATNLGRPELSFPIGYPLLLSPLFHFGPRPLLLLSLAHWLLAIVCMVGVYRWARSQAADAAPWVTALVMANVHIWILYRRTLSEAAFCALLPWTVVAWNAVVAPRDAAGGRHRAVYVLLAVALLALLTAIREAGALVGVGAALVALRAGAPGTRQRRIGFAVLAGILAAAVLAAVVRPERLQAAAQELTAVAGTVIAGGPTTLLEQLRLRILDLGQLVVPGMFKAYDDRWLSIATLCFVPVVAALAVAWWRFARRRADVFAWTAPPYVALYLVWPYGAARYLLPLLPLLWLASWTACAAWPRRRLVFGVVLAAHLGVAVGYLFAIDARRARACDAAWPTVDLVAAQPRQLLQPLAVADGVPECVRLMLELAMDEPVARGGEEPRALLLPAGSAVPEHFAIETAAADYVLARRRE